MRGPAQGRRPPSLTLELAVLGMVVSALLFLVAVILMKEGGFDLTMRSAALRLRETAPEPLEGMAWLAGKLLEKGTSSVASFAVAAVVGLYLAFGRGDRRGGLIIAAVVLATFVASNLLKEFFDRPAPHEWVAHETTGRAFPSGHAAQAIAVWGYLAFLWRRHDTGRRSIVIPLVVLGVAIAAGVARVLLDAHWTTDVLAGWAVGGFILFAAIAATLLADDRVAAAERRRHDERPVYPADVGKLPGASSERGG
jgi:membrane-associated phospholipid phosphatase